jgi:Domain of unknown function (DUF5655)
MAGHECYHCKQWIEEGEAHDCWTTTEAALTGELSEDLREAWERLRETAAELGEQRIYASHNSIMFSRSSCYFYVRPKKSFLEVCVFLGRAVKSPHVRRSDRSSKSKFVNIIQIKHRDQVEAPITDWLREAYGLSEALATKPKAAARTTRPAAPTRSATPKPRPRRKTAVAKKRRPSTAKVSSRSVSLRSRRRR